MSLRGFFKDPLGTRKEALITASRQASAMLDRHHVVQPSRDLLREIAKINEAASRAAEKLGFSDYADNHQRATQKALDLLEENGDPEELTAALRSQLQSCIYHPGEIDL